jgi:hypothetical protein
MYNPTEFRKNKEQLKWFKAVTAMMFIAIAIISLLCLISIGEAQRMTRESAALQERLVRADGEIACLNEIIENLENTDGDGR